MSEKPQHPYDKDFKFKLKRMGVKFHNYINNDNCQSVMFLDTEDAETGRRKDIVYVTDDGKVNHLENESTPITEDDLWRFHFHNISIICDESNDFKIANTSCICTAKHSEEDLSLCIENSYTFHPRVLYTKCLDGEKILSTLKDKVDKQEELSDNNQVELLLLPDTDINMPIEELMKEIAYIIRNANISDETYKDLVACNIQTLKRFFEGDKMTEMLTYLKK